MALASSITDLITFTIAVTFGLVFFGALIWLMNYRPQTIARLFEHTKANPLLFWAKSEGANGMMVLMIFVLFLAFLCMACFAIYNWILLVYSEISSETITKFCANEATSVLFFSSHVFIIYRKRISYRFDESYYV